MGEPPSLNRLGLKYYASSVAPLMQGEAEAARRRIVRQHRLVDFPQVFPRLGIDVEALQQEQVGDHAAHPGDIGGVAEHRAAARGLQELPREALAARALEHAAGAEVDQ